MKSLENESTLSVTLPESVENLRIDVPATVLETLLKSGVDISHSCGGMGTCGTCRVEILSSLDVLHERNELESEMAESRAFERHERLACQLSALHGLKIKIPKE